MKTFIYDILSYDKQDDCNFEIENVPFLNGYGLNSQPMGVQPFSESIV